jgi:hypothetical protein
MKQRVRYFGLIVGGFLLMTTPAVSVRAQYPPGVKQILSDGKPKPMQKLTGLIRVRKDFGVVPMGPGHSQPAVYPCDPFTVAVYDAQALKSKPLALSHGMTQGPDQGEFYTCRYEVSAPAGKGLYAIPVMGGILLLPREDRSPMYITDAWIGGSSSKPPRGWERGFVGKFLTLGTTKGTYLRFDMNYAQVDPN